MKKNTTMKYYALNSSAAEETAKEDLHMQGKTDIEIKSCLEQEHGFEVKVDYREGQIDLETLFLQRCKAAECRNTLAMLAVQQEKYISKLENITKNCSHQVGVLLKEEDILDDEPGKLQCLFCGTVFGSTIHASEFVDNIIDLTKMEYVGTDETKVQIAFEMYMEVRTDNPELTDAEIVSIINNRLNESRNKMYQKIPKGDNK